MSNEAMRLIQQLRRSQPANRLTQDVCEFAEQYFLLLGEMERAAKARVKTESNCAVCAKRKDRHRELMRRKRDRERREKDKQE
jgi:hypothetical protein